MSFTPEDYARKATEIWDAFNDSERHGVRFGIFPAEKMDPVEREGYEGLPLAVALMKHAAKNRNDTT